MFLSATGIHITGVIQFERYLFWINPLGGSLHALIRVDQSKIPPDEPPDWNPAPQQRENGGQFEGQQNIPYGIESTTTTPIIDVMVAYTPAAAASSGNISSLVDACIQSTNDVHINSDANVHVNRIHAVQVSYVESGSLQTDVNRLRGTNDGYMDNIHSLRNQYGADIVVLLVDYGDYLGIAYEIGVGASDAFAVVVDNYAVGNYTFAHEIGHLVGGRHDNDPGITPSRYGHGYRYAPAYWRTVMAIPLYSADPVLRIPYWSNPRKTYGGVAMGTVDWNDNTRVWNERASTVAGFQTPPVPAHSVSVSGPEFLQLWTSGEYTASVTGGSGNFTYNWYRNGGYVGSGNPLSIPAYPSPEMWIEARVTDNSNNETQSGWMSVLVYCDGCPLSIEEQNASDLPQQRIPVDFTLSQNYPNPFNPETEIVFGLPEPSQVKITISDVLGREVLALEESQLSAGYHRKRWTGVDASGQKVGSGVYFYRITATGESGMQFTKVMKMALTK